MLLPCKAEGFRHVKETHLGGLLLSGVVGDPHYRCEQGSKATLWSLCLSSVNLK